MTISTLNGSALWPTVTRGSGEPSRQLGTTSDVASKKYPAIWLSTWPLYGMGCSSTTSKADKRSDATMASSPFSKVYTSRTLPR